MNNMVYTFKELVGDYQPLAGGKGGTLAKLYQMGYAVPEGFVIMPSAFEKDTIKGEAWELIV